MGRRSGVSIQTTTYSQFKGVDFSTDASLVSRDRAPWAVNMIADTGGMPEKRMGWRTLHQLDAPVNGVFFAVFDGEVHFVAHGGTKIYRWTEKREEPELLRVGVKNGRSTAVNMGGKLWLLTGREYLVYDGNAIADVSEKAYVPTTTIAMAPSGGGVAYEGINLLTRQRKNEFIPDGTSTVYQLDGADLGPAEVTATVWGEAKKENVDFTVNRTLGQVTWKQAPRAPAAGAEGAVIITFAAKENATAERVTACTIATTYGVGTSDRVVISGNPRYKNLDWTSGLNDPTYFPDISYAVVGMEATAIMGYLRVGEYLAIIKEDNGHDSTVFLRSAATASDGTVTFPMKQSIAGVGAVSTGGFANILDEPMFLTGTGVYAITTNALTAERIVQNRSFYVDNRLTREPELEQAAAVSWNGMYLVAVNGHAYLLDGRQNKAYRAKSQSEYIYECYYWENVPAVCWMNLKNGAEETLYFGTADGRVCRFNSDMETMSRYSDDGAPITACWATKADDDGDITLLKTMIKKGNSVTIKPYTRSSAKVCFRTESDPVEWQAAYDTMDIFDWEDIDFSRFTFDANDAPREILFNTKVKKYKRLQIIIKNDAVNEGFGVFGITKHYVVGNFAKK
ncbi:MAG: hypothetical protein HFF09_06605 [Oscillospiraceae bacterium]|nr:hypothetical protein [Oscillospiraceae bacterium]